MRKVSKVFETFLVLLLVAMIGATAIMTFHVRNRLEETAISSVKTVLDKSINLLNSDILTAHNALYRYSRYISWDDRDKAITMLGAFLQEYGGLRAIYFGMDGEGYDSKGNNLTISDLPFEDFALSQNQEGFSPCYLDQEEVYVTAMGIPVVKNDVQTGAFYVIYPMEEFSGSLMAKSIRNEGAFYLLDRQADVMVSADYNMDNPEGITTLDKLMSDSSYTKSDIASEIQKPMDQGEDFMLKSKIGGKSCYLFFLPVEENTSWYMCGFLSEKAIKKESSNTLSLIGSIIEMLVVLCVLIVTFVLYFILRRQATEKKERKEKEFQNAIYEALSEKSDVVVCIFDRDTHSLEQVFQNSLRILGRSSEHFLSHPEELQDLCDRTAEGFYERLMSDRITEDEVYDFSMVHPVTQEDVTIRFTVKAGIVIAGSRKYMFYFEDITQSIKNQNTLREAAREAQQANRAKSEFLSNMSHEIRTPMNAIMGMLEIMERNLDDRTRVNDCVGKIRLSAMHLLDIINDILDISRIESGKVNLNLSPFSLCSLISNVSSIIRPQAEAENKRHTFAIYTHHVYHDQFQGDWLRLNQILINILNNSVKYTLSGGRITLDIAESWEAGTKLSTVCFVVRDNGIGMSEEFQKSLGRPFEQEQSQLHIQEGGTGLGLSIVLHLVELMGGSISIDSRTGEGTTITISITLQCLDYENEIGNMDYGDMRVLIADNDSAVVQGAVAALDEIGVRAEGALNVSEAADMIQNRQRMGSVYDVAVIDYLLEGGGLEKLRSLLSDGRTAENPVYYLSAYDQAGAMEIQDSQTDTGLIEKPLFLVRLCDMLQSVKHGANARNHKEEPASQQVISLPALRVLLAEDNDLNREIVLEFLQVGEIEYDCARNGQEAVDLFEKSTEGTYDLILMDIQMPVMDGLTATKRIRESAHPQAKTIPILAMTANAFEEDVERCMCAGMNGHLAKPLNISLLFEMIAKFAGRTN